jgi:uncharacterized protein (TIGR03067 family)
MNRLLLITSERTIDHTLTGPYVINELLDYKGAPMPRFSALLLILSVPSLLGAGEDDVGKELKAFQGTWKAIGLEAGGKAFPKEAVPDFLYIVEAGGKATGRMGQVDYQANMSVDPSKTPKTIDNAHETGAQKGKKQFGIYKVEDGKWIVCMTAPGATEIDRPKSFDTKDTKNVLFIFELVKDAKKP